MAPVPPCCRYYKIPQEVRLVSNTVGWDSLGFWHGVTWFIFLLGVLGYTLGYKIHHQGAYKEYDTVTSDVHGSLDGSLMTNFTDIQLNNVSDKDLLFYNRFWDLTKTEDFAPEMEHSFFVPTNVFITTNQTRGLCSEFRQTEKACISGSDCKGDGKGYSVHHYGVRTGRCVKDGEEAGTRKACEVASWCPVERKISLPSSTEAVLEDTKHFQLRIRNNVQFSKFGLDWVVRKKYTIKTVVEEAIENLIKCKLIKCKKTTQSSPNNHKSLGNKKSTTNLKLAQPPFNANITYHDIAMRGGVIHVNIHWSCFILFLTATSQEDYREQCQPTISFTLMPPNHPLGFKDPKWKGRFVHKPDHDGHGKASTRDLYKTYGIWFRFNVTSNVSRLNVMNAFLVLFVGLGLLKFYNIVFKLVLQCYCNNSKLNSEEVKRARYVDIGDQENLLTGGDNQEAGGQAWVDAVAPIDLVIG